MNEERQLLFVEIDGLNLANQIFNFKERLFFSHPREADENISNAFVIINRPMTIGSGGHAWETEDNRKNAEDSEDALRIVGTFLACYNLVNEKHIIDFAFRVPTAMTFHNQEDVMKHVKAGGGCHPYLRSNRPKISSDDSLNSLNLTKSVFDKAISVIESSQKKIDPLQVSLLSYQRAIQNREVLQDFLGLVTSIESLLSTKEDLRYKFALRSSLFIESIPAKRKEIFDELYKIYGARNKLVHGEDTSAYPYVDYYRFKLYLESIARKVILKYLELASQGKNKTSIVNEIDEMALGFNK